MNLDLHTHTGYSYDAKPIAPAEHVRAAVEHGLNLVGFTEHVEFFYKETLREEEFAPDTVDFAGYEEEVAPFRRGQIILPDLRAQQREIDALRGQYAGRITLRRGAELGQPHAAPELARAFLRDYALDYAIGSVHHLSSDIDWYFLRCENLPEAEIMDDYFRETEKMLRFGGFQILGHIDYPLRLLKQPGTCPSYRDYMDRVDVILRTLVENGIALECNAKSLFGWQKRVGPEDFVLARYRELGGELVTVGSDSHAPEAIGGGIPQALDKLRAAGFAYVTDFADKKPIQHRL